MLKTQIKKFIWLGFTRISSQIDLQSGERKEKIENINLIMLDGVFVDFLDLFMDDDILSKFSISLFLP